MLTLGVPGSGTTAVMMGALTLYNITPGPAMFTEQPDIVWGLIAALLIANVMLLVMNIPLIGLFTRMLTIPLWFLVPAIAAVSAVGVYAVHSTTFDLVLMVALGVLGYVLRKNALPNVAADLRLCAGRNARTKPAPCVVDQQRQYGDSVGKRRDQNAAGDGHCGDCDPAAVTDPS